MRRAVGIIALLAVAASLAPRDASAYVMATIPAKAVGNGGDWYMELAQDPTQITAGIYSGKYEYFFDLYTLGETFYMTDIVGLDNSKIANAQTTTPDGDAYKTQEYFDPDGYANRASWADATGRIVDLWSKGRNADHASAETTNMWRGSMTTAAVGGPMPVWAGTPAVVLAIPHSYSDYVASSGLYEIWKAELTGPGQGLDWFYTQFGVTPAQDTVYIPQSSINAWASTGVGGLVYTLRIVYDEPIVQENIGWSPGGATAQYAIQGDFTIAAPPCIIGDANCDGYVDIGGDIFPAFSASLVQGRLPPSARARKVMCMVTWGEPRLTRPVTTAMWT